MATWNRYTNTVFSFGVISSLICVGPDKFVGGPGPTGDAATSADGGVTWTERTFPVPIAGDMFFGTDLTGNVVVVAPSGVVLYSTDYGVTWTSATPAAASVWRAVTWCPSASLWVAVADASGGGGAATLVMTSPDMINWTLRTASANVGWNQIQANSTLIMATSATNDVMTSTNGIAWTNKTALPATFNGGAGCLLQYSTVLGKFCTGGYDSSLVPTSAVAYSSADGAAWSQFSTDVTSGMFAGMVAADAIGGFISPYPFGPGFSPTSSPDVANSVDAGASWTVEDTTFTGAWGSLVAWDNSGGTFIAYDTTVTDKLLVGTFAIGSIGQITPNTGPVSGGTVVTITGSGFTGATGVNFITGIVSTPATGLVVVDDTTITCVTPPCLFVVNAFFFGPYDVEVVV